MPESFDAPEFSIVIPVYNEEKMAPSRGGRAVRGLDELGWDYELLLCENGSKDGTAELVDELARENPRIRALHETEPNYGRALKHGILEARGTYVFCDEIDLCDVDFYQRAAAPAAVTAKPTWSSAPRCWPAPMTSGRSCATRGRSSSTACCASRWVSVARTPTG